MRRIVPPRLGAPTGVAGSYGSGGEVAAAFGGYAARVAGSDGAAGGGGLGVARGKPRSIFGRPAFADHMEKRRRVAWDEQLERLEADSADGDALQETVPPGGFFSDERIPSTDRLLMPFSCMPREVRDERGESVTWPWAKGVRPGIVRAGRREMPIDATVRAALKAAVHKRGGDNVGTGVRAWLNFCRANDTTPHRPLDPNEPLWVKLEEEWLAMRFVCSLVNERGVAPRTAASYFGEAQSWHLREHGVRLASGIKLERLRQMLRGLRRIRGDASRKVRRGVSAQLLRAAMDARLDPEVPEHANVRAALALAFQGLLRGAEFTSTGAFNADTDLARGDVASLAAERLVVMMRPCKNMNHMKGKTVPLVIGAGGSLIDAVSEMRNMLKVDPHDPCYADCTPMFRHADGKPLEADRMRRMLQDMLRSVGVDQKQFGLHSLRIGGATALFAAGADPMIIRTMGRWSSDCYRLYVRACFEQTMQWTVTAGSTRVSDVAGEFDEVDAY